MQNISALKAADAEARQFPIPANVYAETVVSVRHYTDRLFSFRITRPQSFRFRSGEFVMIGLPNAEKPVFRTYEKFEQINLTHTSRDHAELAYGVELFDALAEDPLIGELTHGRVTLYSSTTREITPRMGRITRLIENGRLYTDLGIEPLNPETDRVMICGSMHMLKDVKDLVEGLGFEEGSLSKPADFVVERAFVG